ncbi:Hydroxysteroid dehydrogenase-like protein 1-like 2 [Homarus americanus]|uniref:Hydroxysteroid dehydrogenase-like protein 1-like 2 n=1 Tax=Homarus americanus TaxID=6706 RepID=A0A8J5JLN6_HOMAM|nr:Hydroxysteroid dehydrogenase-like protein 1-like 2 [Homarus americanus]
MLMGTDVATVGCQVLCNHSHSSWQQSLVHTSVRRTSTMFSEELLQGLEYGGKLLQGFGYVKDVFAVIGILYVGKVTTYLLYDVVTGVRTLFWSRLWDKRLVAKYGKWAEYAKKLAQGGMNIILISRTMEKLKKVETEIADEYGVETEVVQADFSQGRVIYEDIGKHLQDKEIGVLVNNVGGVANLPTKFGNLTDHDIWAQVNVNVASVPAMTNLVLPGMLARRQGAIINIASITCHAPVPYLGIYSATKAFVDYFSTSLYGEYSDSGLTIQTINPGYVSTNLTSFSDYVHTPGISVPTASTYVNSAFSTLGYSHRSSGYWSHACITYIIDNIFGRWMTSYLSGAFEAFLERDAKKKKQ